MGANAVEYVCSLATKSGQKATGVAYVVFIVFRKVVHHATVFFSAMNGDTTSRPSASLYADGLLPSSATNLASVAASLPPTELLMSGISMILKPGSTFEAACISSLVLVHS